MGKSRKGEKVKKWSKEDEQYLKDNWDKQSRAHIAAALDRTPVAVYQKALTMEDIPRKPRQGFTILEDAIIVEMYGSGRSCGVIGRTLGRSHFSIYSRIKVLKKPGNLMEGVF